MRQRGLIAVATHPVQYQAPYFRALAAAPGVDLRVLYAYLPTPKEQGVGFGEEFEWDVPLLDGYPWGTIDDLQRRDESPHGYRALSAPKIRRQIGAEMPAAVLVTGWHSRVLVQAARAARRLRIPVLVRGDSNDLRRRPIAARLRHRWLFRYFSAFLAVGRSNRRFYRKAGVPENRIFDAPHSVDNDRFSRAAKMMRLRRGEIRSEWSIASDGFCILFVGKLEEKKRPFDLLEALEQTRKARNDLRLLVVGSGELERPLRERAHERRLPVTFAGFMNQTEIPRAYAAADALVLPSDTGETWGLVVNEAMASGLPAVVSRSVGCREDLLIEAETGFSFECGDVGTLASCLTSLAAEPERAAAMGEKARDRVVSAYSIARTVEGTVAAFGSVLDTRRSG